LEISLSFFAMEPIAWGVNTVGSHSSLNDLIQWNTPSASPAPDPATTLQAAQQSVQQTSGQILSSFVPTNTSLYGTAPAVDSLLGNISTSAGLNALSQINSARAASSQISPFGSAAEAVTAGVDSKINTLTTLYASMENSAGSSGLPVAYYSN
jgi:hypothetical protein